MPPNNIAPRMSSNEALRRLLAVFTDDSGALKPGAPGGPQPGKNILTTRMAAGGPSPDLATLIVGARADRVGGLLRNLTTDENDKTIWYGSEPGVTDATGATLDAGESVPLTTSGPIYIYKLEGNPVAEYVEIYG
jgi:hypothetical protein